MVERVNCRGQDCFRCSECGLIYESKAIAEKCEQWCKKYKSCNIEIIKNAVKK